MFKNQYLNFLSRLCHVTRASRQSILLAHETIQRPRGVVESESCFGYIRIYCQHVTGRLLKVITLSKTEVSKTLRNFAYYETPKTKKARIVQSNNSSCCFMPGANKVSSNRGVCRFSVAAFDNFLINARVQTGVKFFVPLYGITSSFTSKFCVHRSNGVVLFYFEIK